MSDPYHLDNYTPDESIGYLLKRATGQLSTTIDRALAEFDMTHAQLGIFLRLLHGHADTAADLAREMSIDTGAMTRALDRLEEKGFIQRLRSHADRRMVQVSLIGYMVGGAFLSLAYLDLPYYIFSFVVLCDVLSRRKAASSALPAQPTPPGQPTQALRR